MYELSQGLSAYKYLQHKRQNVTTKANESEEMIEFKAIAITKLLF